MKSSQHKLMQICLSAAYITAVLLLCNHPVSTPRFIKSFEKRALFNAYPFCKNCNEALDLEFMSNQIKLEWDDNRLRRKQEHMAEVTRRIQLKCLSLAVQNICSQHHSHQSYCLHHCDHFEQDDCSSVMHNVRITARSARLLSFTLGEHESAVVVKLCGTKLSWLCKDAEQDSFKLTRYEMKR